MQRTFPALATLTLAAACQPAVHSDDLHRRPEAQAVDAARADADDKRAFLTPVETYAFLSDIALVGNQPLTVTSTVTEVHTADDVLDMDLSELVVTLPPVQLDGGLVAVNHNLLLQLDVSVLPEDAGDLREQSMETFLAAAELKTVDIRSIQQLHNTVGFGGESFSYDALYIEVNDDEEGGLLVDWALALPYNLLAGEVDGFSLIQRHPEFLCALNDICLGEVPTDGVLITDDDEVSVDPGFQPPKPDEDTSDTPEVVAADDCSCDASTFEKTGDRIRDVDQSDHWNGLRHTDGLVDVRGSGSHDTLGFDTLEATPVLKCEVREDCSIKMELSFSNVAATCDGHAVHGAFTNGWKHIVSARHRPVRAIDNSRCSGGGTVLIGSVDAHVHRVMDSSYHAIIRIGNQAQDKLRVPEWVTDILNGILTRNEGLVTAPDGGALLSGEAEMSCK